MRQPPRSRHGETILWPARGLRRLISRSSVRRLSSSSSGATAYRRVLRGNRTTLRARRPLNSSARWRWATVPPVAGRVCNFFPANYFFASLSCDRSTTKHFSRAFSVKAWYSRTVSRSAPAYPFCQRWSVGQAHAQHLANLIHAFPADLADHCPVELLHVLFSTVYPPFYESTVRLRRPQTLIAPGSG